MTYEYSSDEFGEGWRERLLREVPMAAAIGSRYEAGGCSWSISGDGHTGYEAEVTNSEGRFTGHSQEGILTAMLKADDAASRAIGKKRVQEILAAQHGDTETP